MTDRDNTYQSGSNSVVFKGYTQKKRFPSLWSIVLKHIHKSLFVRNKNIENYGNHIFLILNFNKTKTQQYPKI